MSSPRHRLMNPPNAMVDHGIEMKNGWPVRRPPAPLNAPKPAVFHEPIMIDWAPVAEWVCPDSAEPEQFSPPPPRLPSAPVVAGIISMVAHSYGLLSRDILGRSRCAKFVEARHVAMYLVKSLTRRSLPAVGRSLGGRDHTTVLHAIRKIEHTIVVDPDFKQRVEHLTARVIFAGAAA